jgi:PKD repeat protein
MKCFSTLWLCICLLLLDLSSAAQPSWQWGKRGGSLGDDGGVGNVEDVIDIATDTKGNIYVLGKAYATGNVDGHVGISNFDRLIIASWNCNGNFRWKKVFGSGSSCIGRSLRADTLGGVYICGAMASYNAVGGPGYFDTDSTLNFNNRTLFVVKYDTTGTLKWLKMPQPDTVSVSNPSGAFDMDVAPNGDVYLYSQLTPGGYDNGAFTITANKLYVLKYNASGLFQNVTPLNLTVSGSVSVGYGYFNASNAHFKRDHKNGRYYLCGKYASDFGTMTFGSTNITKPAYLGSFDSNGNNLWTKQNNGNSFNAGMISGRAVIDDDENIYIGGITYSGDGWNGHIFTNDFYTTFATSCPFIVKMDKNGNNIWAVNAQSSGGNNFAGIAMANNTIACTGPYVQLKWGDFKVEQPAGLPKYDNFLARIDASTGLAIGMDSLKSTYGFEELSSAITSDRNGNFYVGGQFEYDLFVGPNTLSSMGGDVDWFVAKFGSPNCNCTVPTANFSHASGSGNTFNFTYTGTTPYTGISWDFGDGSPAASQVNPSHTYAASGTYNVCVTVTNACGSNTYCKSITTNEVSINKIPGFEMVNIYPNPATQSITISNIEQGVDIAVYNTTGQCVIQTLTSGNKAIIDVSKLSNGIYIIRLTGKDGKQGMSKMIKQ